MATPITDSMKMTIEETARRRQIQARLQQEHGITPETIRKRIHELDYHLAEADYVEVRHRRGRGSRLCRRRGRDDGVLGTGDESRRPKMLEFERAAKLRDRIRALRQQELLFGESIR